MAAAAALCISTWQPAAGAAPGDWTQWGGPTRNFMSDATGLASSWPATGPRRLWSRPLGEGHSSVLVEGSRLYTMYRPFGLMNYVRRSQEEVVIALDAGSGRTLWEYRSPGPTGDTDVSYGAGPHGTPLVADNILYATSSRRELFALDKMSGKLLWSHDFRKELNAPNFERRYVCSPLAF